MGIRRLARQRALQLLYALEYSQKSFEDTEADFLNAEAKRRKGWGGFPRELAKIVHERAGELDKQIAPALRHWTIDRLPCLDRLCLRMAVAELAYFPDVPLRTTIDEYIELAKLFGAENAPQYINGVLDCVAEAYRHKDFGPGGSAPPPAGKAPPPAGKAKEGP